MKLKLILKIFNFKLNLLLKIKLLMIIYMCTADLYVNIKEIGLSVFHSRNILKLNFRTFLTLVLRDEM